MTDIQKTSKNYSKLPEGNSIHLTLSIISVILHPVKNGPRNMSFAAVGGGLYLEDINVGRCRRRPQPKVFKGILTSAKCQASVLRSVGMPFSMVNFSSKMILKLTSAAGF